MISNFLVKTFVKDNENTKNQKVRNAYGTLGGIIGIIINSLLFLIKFSVGMLVGSIAVSADAFNNLSDAASSIITIIGFKMANKPADAEHPFGHGRIEYLSALIVAFMVMLVGVQFIRSSFERILNPQAINFELVPFILLLISIGFKIWLSSFNKFLGNKINSSALKAAATDALGDVFTSSTVAISFFIAKFTDFPIDGYIGILVALAILYAGFSLVRETLNPLLGEAPDAELVNSICEMVLSYENITGVHDLIVHNYGPGRVIASIHAEIPSDIDIMEIHNVIDKAERQISKELDLHLVIHMDPICVVTDEIQEAWDCVAKTLRKYPAIKSMHDFRVVGEGEIKNLIFDIVLSPSEKLSQTKLDIMVEEIKKSIREEHPQYNCVITVDYDFV
ncbi:cation diffusion facilitator family transporter [Clostridium chauvoei]|uniref:Cation diffusion facilitator family transporter n=2 Tax=Clostridium chauvoei TaxID=46867 RepID=A0ABD4RJR5_9CLOT|nr:cation diffusion facilitator family transporter [Clostridium chauvoei]ATD54159.1 cation-efflux pump [Clostridium chauvoei]ATD58161.1 cation-efflux pump [Clostridium chauvoei]MBX7281352.1 cation diffusion facilitator family transporter [Clostridium chauvoei]MBX7283834.1 cation diffusion facilitator family transporter [Clostridium chauvoei]MBX7286441.1 cation diffusion facilitator family transporter [Clostridium chauvoei]